MSDFRNAAGGGITLGMIIAGILSYTYHHAFGWAIVHAICSWFYVIYHLCEGRLIPGAGP